MATCKLTLPRGRLLGGEKKKQVCGGGLEVASQKFVWENDIDISAIPWWFWRNLWHWWIWIWWEMISGWIVLMSHDRFPPFLVNSRGISHIFGKFWLVKHYYDSPSMVYMTSTPSFGSFVGKPSRHTTLLEPLDARLCYVDIKRGTINRSYIFPIPEYLFDVQQAGNRNLWEKKGTRKMSGETNPGGCKSSGRGWKKWSGLGKLRCFVPRNCRQLLSSKYQL